MEEPTNIFHKIFEIMDHYENILDNSSYEGDDKYTEKDDFFAFLFKNMKKQEATPKKGAETNDEEKNETNDVEKTETNDVEKPETNDEEKPETNDEEKPETKDEEKTEIDPNKELESETKKKVDKNPVIKAYVKKCYRKIVLKCHPDKNKSIHNADKLFIKCHNYYDNGFLIGLLYIFYLYKILPPAPLNNTSPTELDDDSSILLDQIFKEIRMVQDKLTQFNSHMEKHT